MKTVVVVQARMTSTRLPGKILKNILGKAVLELQIERIRRISNANEIVVATTVNRSDDPVIALCDRLGIATYRGSEHNVLERFYLAAEMAKADCVVRINGDCPLIDPEISEKVIQGYLNKSSEIDYISNNLEATFPVGLLTEAFAFSALKAAHLEAVDPYEREHVTPFIYFRPERFKLLNFKSEINLNHHRWVLDTPEDFEKITLIYEKLYRAKPNFVSQDILELFGD